MQPRWLGMLAGLTFLCGSTVPTIAETRIALVIGNSAYKTVTVLPNPANDARVMTELLKSAQFEVVSAPNLSQSDMRRALRDFAELVSQKGPDTVSLVYFAGHGVQIEGENYLVPIDAAIARESDVAIETVRLNDVMSALASTPSKTRIVILDACRNNPFASINRTTGRGLAIVDAPTGSIVSYATAPGAEALDGAGENSPFTAALIEVAREPNLPIEQAFKRIRLNVHKTTEGRQTPWESSSLTADFSFFGSAGAGQRVASGAGTLPKGASELISRQSKPAGFWKKELQGRSAEEAFELVIREDDVEAYEEFITLYSATAFAPRARGLLERRREMMTWFTAVTVNTPLAYQAFLDRYPGSDLAATARRMRDRVQVRAQSANLTRGLPGLGGPTPAATPAALPVSLPAPACNCTPPRAAPPRAEPKRAAPPPTRTAGPRPPPPPPVVRVRRPPTVVVHEEPRRPPSIGIGELGGLAVGIGIGRAIGRGGGHRGPSYPRGRHH